MTPLTEAVTVALDVLSLRRQGAWATIRAHVLSELERRGSLSRPPMWAPEEFYTHPNVGSRIARRRRSRFEAAPPTIYFWVSQPERMAEAQSRADDLRIACHRAGLCELWRSEKELLATAGPFVAYAGSVAVRHCIVHDGVIDAEVTRLPWISYTLVAKGHSLYGESSSAEGVLFAADLLGTLVDLEK